MRDLWHDMKGVAWYWAAMAVMVILISSGCFAGPPHVPMVKPASPEGAQTFDADAGCCTIPDGLWVVGKDITPGKYRAMPAASYGCYWERRSVTDDSIDGIIANGFAGEGEVATVTIRKADKAFRSSGCRQWRLVKE